MGLFGGPHCIAMCGAACAGIGHAAGSSKNSALWMFQIGRAIGYGVLGAVMAASIQGLGWMTAHTAVLRPVWTLFHVSVMVLGLVLVWKAQQPIWLEDVGKRIWTGARRLALGRGRGAPFVIGLFWTFLPCGLLYSALLLAGLAGTPLHGAWVMVLFAAGTSVSMMLGPWLWLRLRSNDNGDWGVRLAGAALAGSAAWALWLAYAHDQAPWCAT